MTLDVDTSKVNSGDPAFISFEGQPHNAADNVSVDKDEEGIIHDLHHSFLLHVDGHVSDLLENLLQSQHFQKRHNISE